MPPIMLKKKYNHTVSAVKGSNRIIACTKADLLSVKNGSYFSISGDNEFYKIISKNKISFIRSVTVLDGDRLRIEENVNNNLLINDVFSFVNQEFELSDALILDKGKGYKAGDILKIEGGICKYNSIDQNDLPTEILIDSVGENGEIEHISIKTKGIYITPPPLEFFKTSELESPMRLYLNYKPSNTIYTEERSITHIERYKDYSIIYFNHPLPPRVEKGMISLNKWEILISSEYLNENKFDVNYEIIKDFTSSLNLPLMNENTSSVYLAYNESMVILDKKINELNKKIDLLKIK